MQLSQNLCIRVTRKLASEMLAITEEMIPQRMMYVAGLNIPTTP